MIFEQAFDMQVPEDVANRITIDDDGWPVGCTPDQWVNDPEALVQWLEKRPSVSCRIGHWCILLFSDDAADILLGSDDCPCGACTVVECHTAGMTGRGHNTTKKYYVKWDFC